jgi:hypothetical protein
MGWEPMETAPVGKRLMFWWRPIGDNPYAEVAVFGQLCYGEEAGKWFSDAGQYQSADHLTAWQFPPKAPDDRQIAERRKSSLEKRLEPTKGPMWNAGDPVR